MSKFQIQEAVHYVMFPIGVILIAAAVTIVNFWPGLIIINSWSGSKHNTELYDHTKGVTVLNDKNITIDKENK